MKNFILAVLLLGIGDRAYSQWSSSGTHISNSNTGNVGLGLPDPATKLHVKGSITVEPDNGSSSTYFYTSQSGATRRFLEILAGGTAAGVKAGGLLIADMYNFGTPSANDLIVKGGVSIGVSTLPSGYSLAVNGKVRATEVKVETGWADFVFKPEYKLRSLKETEQFIKTNGHLPEIPSAAEVEKDGIFLGEMNAKLLQKIEELTLHLIEQNKRMDEQENKIKLLTQAQKTGLIEK